MLEEIRTKVLLGCNNLILYMYYYISCEYGGRIRRHDSANSRPSRALIMSSLRFLSVVRQATTSFALARRGYAEVSDKLKLSLVLPHKVGTQISFTAAMGWLTSSCLWIYKTIFSSQDVVQVNIPAESGDMGILSNHVPSIEPLCSGVVEIIENSGSQKFFSMLFNFHFRSLCILRTHSFWWDCDCTP